MYCLQNEGENNLAYYSLKFGTFPRVPKPPVLHFLITGRRESEMQSLDSTYLLRYRSPPSGRKSTRYNQNGTPTATVHCARGGWNSVPSRTPREYVGTPTLPPPKISHRKVKAAAADLSIVLPTSSTGKENRALDPGWYNTTFDGRLRRETWIAHGYSPNSGFGTMPLLQKKFSNVSRADFIPYLFSSTLSRDCGA